MVILIDLVGGFVQADDHDDIQSFIVCLGLLLFHFLRAAFFVADFFTASPLLLLTLIRPEPGL